MSGFPSLQPAFTARLSFQLPSSVGLLPQGSVLQNVKCTGGSIKSESGFPIQVEAQIVHGDEWLRVDPSQKLFRTDGQILCKNNDESFFKFNYGGVSEITPEFIAIVQSSPDAKSTDFGHEHIRVSFETSKDEHSELNDSIFVGKGRFIIVPGEQVVVEYKISKVV